MTKTALKVPWLLADDVEPVFDCDMFDNGVGVSISCGSGLAPEYGACRVAPGSYPPGAPTDPAVRDYRSRLVEMKVHYGAYRRCTMRGRGSGNRSSTLSMCGQSTYPV